MKQEILLGVTDRTVLVFVPDPASTDGSGKTGLAHTDMTVSATRVETDNDVVVTDYTSSLNALTNLTDAHNDWGWKEVSNTLAPGLYRLDIADAIFASGAWSAVVYVMITTSAAAASPMEFILVAYNPLDAVRLGLTALPNAAADAAGGLPISDAGGLDLDAQIGTDIDAILTDTGTTLEARFTGITSLAQWLGLLGAKHTGNTTARTELNATGAGSGTYDETTDSLQGSGDADPTIQDLVDAVLDEPLAGHADAGSVGEGISNASSAGDPWSTALPGAYGAGTAGKLMSDANVAVTSGTHGNAALNTDIDAIATLLALTDADAASILALLDDARTEPAQGAPPVNPDLATKIDWLYKLMRNKITQTATTMSIYNDAGNVVDHKSTVSDDATTYTRGEIVSGP